jgi:hypothetical protein
MSMRDSVGSLDEVLRKINDAIHAKRKVSEAFESRNWEAGWAEGAQWVLDHLQVYLASELVGFGVRVDGRWEGGALDRGEKRLPMNMPREFAELFVAMHQDERKKVSLHRLFAGPAVETVENEEHT